MGAVTYDEKDGGATPHAEDDRRRDARRVSGDPTPPAAVLRVGPEAREAPCFVRRSFFEQDFDACKK